MRNYMLFVGSMVIVVMLMSGCQVAFGADDTITRVVKVVCVDHHPDMNDTISVVTTDGHMWMFFAEQNHSFEVGQVLLVTFKGRRIINVL